MKLQVEIGKRIKQIKFKGTGKILQTKNFFLY
jgi:hypothetical protein